MIRYYVERIECDEAKCGKDATVQLRVEGTQMRDETTSRYCTAHADVYIARMDEMNAERVRQ